MRLVRQVELKNITTTLQKNDHLSYDNEKVYNSGDKATINEKNWLCTKDNTKGKKPSEHENVLWISQPINAYAMFDYVNNSKTIFNKTMTVSFDVDRANKICFFGLKANNIKIKIENTFETKEINLDLRKDKVNDLRDYFFEDFSLRKIDFADFLTIFDSKITITFEAIGEGEIGYVFVGNEQELGITLYGGTGGIRSFSKKVKNEWGNTTISKRRTKKKFKVPVLVDEIEYDYLMDVFSEIDGEPCVFIGDETKRKENLVIFGLYEDFEQPITVNSITYTLAVESII